MIRSSIFQSLLNAVKDLVSRSKDPSKVRTGEAPALNLERPIRSLRQGYASLSIG